MSSLTAKENRRRSPVTQRTAAKKAKKARPAKNKVAVSPKSAKSKKLSVSRTAKKARPAGKFVQPKKSAAKKTSARSPKQARTLSGKASKLATAKRGTKIGARKSQTVHRPVPEPKALPSPKAIAAIKAFEHALKLFNRHDFAGAKGAFEDIIGIHADQTDIAAPVRTYLAICEQKMARTSAKTRNPDALYNQGVFEFNRGNVEAAIDIFEKALKAEPRADHLLYSLAAAYARGGDDVKSVEALRKAIAVNPVHRSHARHDPDFTPLRSNREFMRVSGLDLEYNE